MTNITIIPKNKHKERINISAKDKGIGPKKKSKKRKECPGNWFGGVGISTKIDIINGNELITQIHPGYPAEEAGLQVNDLIVGISGDQIIGEVGTVVTLTIKREESFTKFRIVREKICY